MRQPYQPQSSGGVSDTDISKATDTAPSNSETIGIVGPIVLLVILLIFYYCGGYVAGRMARLNGIRQGVAVWGAGALRTECDWYSAVGG